MKRKNGYYWVKDCHDYWYIAKWDGEYWSVCGSEQEYQDCDFSIIYEQKIIRDK